MHRKGEGVYAFKSAGVSALRQTDPTKDEKYVHGQAGWSLPNMPAVYDRYSLMEAARVTRSGILRAMVGAGSIPELLKIWESQRRELHRSPVSSGGGERDSGL